MRRGLHLGGIWCGGLGMYWFGQEKFGACCWLAGEGGRTYIWEWGNIANELIPKSVWIRKLMRKTI